MSEQSKERQKQYHFFVDAKKYETERPFMSGADIKNEAGVTSTYQLFLEEEGDNPDKAISDTETVNLSDKIRHFYAVPPATFGNR